MTDEKKDELVPVSGDQFIPIKATPDNMRAKMNKLIQERIDKEEARRRQEQNPPKFRNEAEYYKCQTQQKTLLANGAVVAGNVTEEEKRALNSDSDATLRRLMTMRQKAQEIMQRKRLENKSLGNYYKGLRGE
jgi:hypothetical protein